MEPTFIKEWLPVFVIGAVTVMIYMLFRILSTRVIRFILNKLPDDADQNIATALYKPGRLAIISGVSLSPDVFSTMKNGCHHFRRYLSYGPGSPP